MHYSFDTITYITIMVFGSNAVHYYSNYDSKK